VNLIWRLLEIDLNLGVVEGTLPRFCMAFVGNSNLFKMKIGKIDIRIASIYKQCRHKTKWSVRLRHPIRSLKRDLYSFIPKYEKYWSGALIHIGTNHIYLVIDKRNINSIEDFADEMSRPTISNILRKFR
jgi:hypothetical protein